MRIAVALALAVAVGCTGSEIDGELEPDSLGQTEADQAPPPFPLDPDGFPTMDRERPGHLRLRVVHSDTSYVLDKVFAPSGFACEDPRIVVVQAQQDSIGVILLLSLPDSGDFARSYDIEHEDSGVTPSAQARVGVQRVRTDKVTILRGAEGAVTVDEMGETVSGRALAMLEETTFFDSVAIAIDFREVAVPSAAGDDCSVRGQDRLYPRADVDQMMPAN